MTQLVSLLPPIFVLGGWVALAVTFLAIAHRRGQLTHEMLSAVDKSGPPDPEISREEMAKGFVWISIVWFVLIHATAALTLHFSLAGGTLATIAFFAVAAWALYEVASSPWVLGRMYPGTIGMADWIGSFFGSVVWLYLIFAVTWSRFFA